VWGSWREESSGKYPPFHLKLANLGGLEYPQVGDYAFFISASFQKQKTLK
jgi:hypothetical protein